MTRPSTGLDYCSFGDGDGPKWLVLNYDLASVRGEELASLVRETKVEFLVIDEAHYVKQRGVVRGRASATSNRRRMLAGIRADAAMVNPDLHVLAMSATPVVNDLNEAVSLIELVEGARCDIGTRPTLGNVTDVHYRFVRNGFRFTPRYDIAVEHEFPSVGLDHILNDLLAADRRDFDAIVAAEYHDHVVAAVRAAKSRGKGVLVYTEYVENIVEPLRARLDAEGFKTALYTGAAKEVQPDLLGDSGVDVLIGTSAIGTGVDGLQYWADSLVFLTLPWTHAAYTQVIGRVIRQGSTTETVRVVVPVGSLAIETDRGQKSWSWTSQT